MVVGGDPARPFTQTVTTACHHCADPACLNGCPVLAYEKDPATGIVRHLDDQCIGCSYCVLKCPYDVPKFNARLGIVRKCDMCHGRLAEGEAPACAQACPTHAIRIVTVKTPAPLRADTVMFLRAAPAPDYTQPTTRYLSRRQLPADLMPADAAMLRPQPAHWPLAVMLTLLPAAIGLQLGSLLPLHNSSFILHPWLVPALGALGLAASTLHLGQPLRAWRIFLGWRKSWLSREAMLFGAWFGLTLATLRFPALLPAAAAAGLAGLFCSAMLYADTRRAGWRLTLTLPRFFGMVAVFALAVFSSPLAAVLLTARLVGEAMALRDESVSTRLALGPLLGVTATRFVLALLAAPALAFASGPAMWAALALALLADLAGLHLFFRTVDAPKMPGVPA